MFLINHETRQALERQLLHAFKDPGYNLAGLFNLHSRWIGFKTDLLDSEEINHLWPNKRFRDAYYSVTVIAETIGAVYHKDTETLSSMDRVDLINKIVAEIEEGEGVMYEQLLEAAKLIAPTKTDEEDKEEYENLINDLQAFLILNRCYMEWRSIQEKYAAELLNFFDPDKDKRKQMKKAA